MYTHRKKAATVAMTKSRPLTFFSYKNCTIVITVRLSYLNGYGCKEEYVYFTIITDVLAKIIFSCGNFFSENQSFCMILYI